MDRVTFENALTAWSRDGGAHERRDVAVVRILDCFDQQLRAPGHGNNELDLHDLALAELPECINSLTHLRVLNLSGNAFTRIPDVFGNFPKMELLNLERNLLTILPRSLSKLPPNCIVELTGNNISPGVIEELTRLSAET